MVREISPVVASNASRDLVCSSGPDKGCGIFVVDLDVLADSSLQLLHSAKHAAANPLVREFGERAFDQVDPRTVGGPEVNVKAGTLGEPLADDRGFVSGVVVDDEVYLQPGWHLRFDGMEELAELHRAMATMQLADHPVAL
jgi:hypothetical protein